MNDKEFNKYLGIANHDIQVANNHEELKSYVASILFELDKLQSNWNSLREWLENLIDNFQEDVSTPILHEQMTIRLVYEYMENLDKMNELESGDNNEKV